MTYTPCPVCGGHDPNFECPERKSAQPTEQESA